MDKRQSGDLLEPDEDLELVVTFPASDNNSVQNNRNSGQDAISRYSAEEEALVVINLIDNLPPNQSTTPKYIEQNYEEFPHSNRRRSTKKQGGTPTGRVLST